MRFIKQTAYMVGTLMAVVIIATLIAPKSVHALVATLVRDVDNPARATIVSASCSAFVGPYGNLFCVDMYSVPNGQRLVIEQVEVACVTPNGNSVNSVYFTFGNGTHGFVLTQQQGPDPFGRSGFFINQSVRYSVEPGSQVDFQAYSNDTSGSTNCTPRLNGYLISYP